MISKEYMNVLRKLAVSEFVKTNSRSPTSAELNQIELGIKKKYFAVDETGMSSLDLVKPNFRQINSIDSENNNRSALFYDLMTLNQKLDHLVNKEESAYRGATSTIYRTNKTLDELSSRLDNLLLLNGKDDVFLHGIEESFSHQLNIDRVSTTATVESNSVTCGKKQISAVDLSQTKLKVTPIAEKGIVSYVANSSIDSLKESDGNVWSATINTRYQSGRVSLLIEFAFIKAIDLSTCRIYGLPIESNSIATCTLFYSLDNSTFAPLEPVELHLTDSLIIPMSLTGVRKIQILLSKEAADSSRLPTGEYEYQFLLDQISFEQNSFEQLSASTLQTLAYEVLDVDGLPVYFTKATMSACTIEPMGTGVAFYLSNDDENWFSVDHFSKTSSIISFGDHTPDQSIGYAENLSSPFSLVEKLNSIESFDYASEAYLNAYVTADYADRIPFANITIHRNIVIDTSSDIVSGTSPGWIFDNKSSTYSTVVFISNPEGRTIDFGPKGARVNGNKVTGMVTIKSGYSNFSTDSSNWQVLIDDFTSENTLRSKDSLYPYNHKYLIEGYSYSESFKGDRVYSGVDEYFGLDMYYISAEEFDAIPTNSPKYYSVFTTEEVDDKLYFKVKVNKQSSTWREELFNLDFIVQSANSNKLYVRALLSSNDSKLTPVIESFKVRVV